MQDSTDPGSARSDGIQEGGAGHELEIQGSEVCWCYGDRRAWDHSVQDWTSETGSGIPTDADAVTLNIFWWNFRNCKKSKTL